MRTFPRTFPALVLLACLARLHVYVRGQIELGLPSDAYVPSTRR